MPLDFPTKAAEAVYDCLVQDGQQTAKQLHEALAARFSEIQVDDAIAADLENGSIEAKPGGTYAAVTEVAARGVVSISSIALARGGAVAIHAEEGPDGEVSYFLLADPTTPLTSSDCAIVAGQLLVGPFAPAVAA
jgi:hypothetical protein